MGTECWIDGGRGITKQAERQKIERKRREFRKTQRNALNVGGREAGRQTDRQTEREMSRMQ